MEFKAFISYSHTADGKLAPAVQEGLRVIAKPWYRLRTMRVFRDQTNLGASPGLWSSILAALEQSEFFLFMASPTAAQSPWVQKEIEWWLNNRSSETFLILLTEGEIAWDETQKDFNWNQTTALPAQISKVFNEEPLYIEMRWARSSDQLSLRHSQFRAAILDVAATLLRRPKDQLDGEDVRQFRRTRRVLWSGIAILATLLVAAVLAAYAATQQRDIAISRMLAANSEATLATNPELALLLAREAVRTTPDNQNEAVLRKTMVRSPERYLHAGSAGQLLTSDFAGSSRFIVVSDSGKQVSVWNTQDGALAAKLPAISTDRLVLSCSPDGAVVALQTKEDSFSLYDTKQWKVLAELPGKGARFSPDGRWLAATAGNEIRRWDFPSMKPRQPIALPDGYSLVEVSPDSRLLFATTTDVALGPGLVLEVDSGVQTARIPPSSYFADAVFSPDSRLILAGAQDGMELRESRGGSKYTSLKGDTGWVEEASFSPDGKTLVTGSRDGILRLWDVATGKYLRDLRLHSNRISRSKFSRDGALILSVSVDGTGCLWGVESGRCLVEFGGQGDNIWDARFSPDSQHFLTAHLDGTVRLWKRDLWCPSLVVAADKKIFAFNQSVISADGHVVLTLAAPGSTWLWDVDSGKLKATLQNPAINTQIIALSHDGSLAAFAPDKSAVQLWNPARNQLLRLGNSSTGATALAFGPDSKQLLTADAKGRVQFWNTLDGSLLRDWPGSGGPINQLLFAPDGSAVLMGSPPDPPEGSSVLQSRDARTGALLWKVAPGTDEYIMAASTLSSQGHPVLLVLVNSVAQLWDLTTGKQLKTFTGHSDDLWSGAFSPDGRFLATASGYRHASGEPPDDGNEVRIWDIQSGRDLIHYRVAALSLQQVAFGADGITVITSGMEPVVRIYRCDACLPLPEVLKNAATHRDFTAEERTRYIPVGSLWAMLFGRNRK